MKKLLSVAVSSLLGMTFVVGAMMDQSFYVENPSIWVTKKNHIKRGGIVTVKVEGLTNTSESDAPQLMSPGQGKGEGRSKAGMKGMRKSSFVGYLSKNGNANVTITCKMKDGTATFKTTVQSLVGKGRRGEMLKSEDGRYTLRASAARVVVSIQVPPYPSNTVVQTNAYKIKFHGFRKMKMEQGMGKRSMMAAQGEGDEEEDEEESDEL